MRHKDEDLYSDDCRPKFRSTVSERTNRKYTRNDIINAARALHKGSLCVDAIPARDLFTLEELNEIVEKIIDDSRYYGGM